MTFLDANVLIAAATGRHDASERAMEILDDPARRFAASALVRLEVLPKAIFHGRKHAVEFYETYFAAVAHWVNDLNALIGSAFDEAAKHDIAPRDPLHIAAAVAAGASELITAERPTSPMFRTGAITIRSIHPTARS